MMKKVMALLMAALLMLALAGCGENKNNTNRPGSNSNNTTNGSNDADKGRQQRRGSEWPQQLRHVPRQGQ